MEVIERDKPVKEVKGRLAINVPSWIIQELCFESGDKKTWVLLKMDDGEIVGCLRRVPKKKKEVIEVEKGT